METLVKIVNYVTKIYIFMYNHIIFFYMHCVDARMEEQDDVVFIAHVTSGIISNIRRCTSMLQYIYGFNMSWELG